MYMIKGENLDMARQRGPACRSLPGGMHPGFDVLCRAQILLLQALCTLICLPAALLLLQGEAGYCQVS